MSSLFEKDPDPKVPPPPYSRHLIEKEIAHLNKGKSTRYSQSERRSLVQFLTAAVILFILGLFAMDPFLYSYYRGNAIRAYLYLHNYGDQKLAASLVSSGILKESEARTLDNHQGSFQDYFPNSAAAKAKVDSIVAFTQTQSHLDRGEYEQLDWFNKIRYILFFHFGLKTPQAWDVLNPSVDS